MRIFAGVAMLVGLLPNVAMAQFGCWGLSSRDGTLLNRTRQADVVSLAVLIDAWPGADEDESGAGIFEIVQIGRDRHKRVQTGHRVVVDLDFEAIQGNSAILLGSGDSDEEIDWSAELASSRAYAYLVRAPDSERSAAKQLAYHLKHLDSADPLIRSEARLEFDTFTIQDWQPLRPKLSRTRILASLKEPDQDTWVRAMFFELLSLCGQPEDAALFQHEILATHEDQSGLSRTIMAYLRLAGEEGLKFLETSRLDNPDVDVEDKACVLEALHGLHDEPSSPVPQERIRQVLRKMLKCRPLLESVVHTLGAVHDWSAAEQVRSFYDVRNPCEPATDDVKTAVISYFVQFRDEENGRHVDDALVYLRQLRRLDRARVADFDPPKDDESVQPQF